MKKRVDRGDVSAVLDDGYITIGLGFEDPEEEAHPASDRLFVHVSNVPDLIEVLRQLTTSPAPVPMLKNFVPVQYAVFVVRPLSGVEKQPLYSDPSEVEVLNMARNLAISLGISANPIFVRVPETVKGICTFLCQDEQGHGVAIVGKVIVPEEEKKRGRKTTKRRKT